MPEIKLIKEIDQRIKDINIIANRIVERYKTRKSKVMSKDDKTLLDTLYGEISTVSKKIEKIINIPLEMRGEIQGKSNFEAIVINHLKVINSYWEEAKESDFSDKTALDGFLTRLQYLKYQFVAIASGGFWH